MIVRCKPYLHPFEGYDKKFPRSTSFIKGYELGFKYGHKTAENEIAELKGFGQLCLICGKEEPCMKESDLKPTDPGIPCTFDPTPKQLFDWWTTMRKERDCLKHYTLPDGGQIDLTNPDVIDFLVGEFTAGYKQALKNENAIEEDGNSGRKRDAIDRRIRFMKNDRIS